VNLQNLFTITNYSGFDPEALGAGSADPNETERSAQNALLRGVDAGQIYPNARTISLGIDLGF
jgi:hypothetical protein